MGKRGGAKRAASNPSGSHNSISLREKTSGKNQGKGGTSNVKSILKHDHLQNLAVWASGEASVLSLAAFFGHRLASAEEGSGIQRNHSLFPCQRCETILQPGFNCTIRIEKNQQKAQGRFKKSSTSTQNNVVFTCHFCSYRNLKRGTPKGHMKEICPPKVKPSSKSEPAKPVLQKCSSEKHAGSKDEVIKVDEIVSPTTAGDTPPTDSPATPLLRPGTTLLDGKRRKRNRSGSKKPAESESASTAIDAEKTVSASSKRKRKSWMSLKEIADNSKQNNNRNITNITIPFFL